MLGIFGHEPLSEGCSDMIVVTDLLLPLSRLFLLYIHGAVQGTYLVTSKASANLHVATTRLYCLTSLNP